MGLGKTEWEDILIEHGIIPAPPRDQKEERPDIIYDTTTNFNNKDHRGEYDEIEDLFNEDAEGEDPFFQQYRLKHLQELKKIRERGSSNHFGSMTEISRNDFVKEVSEASASAPVLVFLYQTSSVKCQLLGRWLTNTAAPSNPSIKFIQILSTRCIQNYPDSNLPTILLYRHGAVQKQILHADIDLIQSLIEQIKVKEAEVEAANSNE